MIDFLSPKRSCGVNVLHRDDPDVLGEGQKRDEMDFSMYS